MIPDTCACTALHAATAGMHMLPAEGGVLAAGAAFTAGVAVLAFRAAHRRAVVVRLPLDSWRPSGEARQVIAGTVVASADETPAEVSYPAVVAVVSGPLPCSACRARTARVRVRFYPAAPTSPYCDECTPALGVAGPDPLAGAGVLTPTGRTTR